MRKHIVRRALVISLAAGLLATAAAPAAIAQDEPQDTTRIDRFDDRIDTVAVAERIKDAALAAIDRRLETLDRLTAKVEASDHVTREHAAALLADYRDARAGLEALAGEIAAETDPRVLLELAASIAADFRIYLIVVPKSVEVVVSDTIVAVARRLEEAGAEVQAIIDGAGHDRDVAEAQRLLNAAMADAARAAPVADPVAESVIDLAAPDWPDPADRLLSQGRSDLRTAGDTLRSGIEHLRAAIRALRGDGATG